MPIEHSCRDCGVSVCVHLTRCWPCYQRRSSSAEASISYAASEHARTCSNCGISSQPATPPPMEEEEFVPHAKMITSAHADAYGIRVPSKVHIQTLRDVWSDCVPHVSSIGLRSASSRNPALNSFTIKNQIIPKEYLTRMHKSLVTIAKAKPLPVQDQPLPAHTDSPDLSLLKMIGVEFEGGWYGDRRRAHGLHIKRDGSVHVESRHPEQTGGRRDYGERDEDATCSDPSCDNPDCQEAQARARGESIIAPPTVDTRNRLSFHYGEIEFGPWNAISFASDWEDSFDYSYPEEVNQTCGQHVHFSFISSGVYGAFVRQDFRGWLMNGLIEWGEAEKESGAEFPSHFWDRLLGTFAHGGQNYCQAIYSPEQLWNMGDRYGQVNYCARKHGTMEIRVLPMFEKPAQSKAAIAELVRLVAIWANAFAPRPRKPILIGQAEVESEQPGQVVV